MTMAKQHIIIKGNKEGLQFLLDPDCSYQDLIDELKSKIRNTHAQFLQGPITHVHLYLGSRYLTEEQRDEIKGIIQSSGTLLVKGIYSDVISRKEAEQRARASMIKVEVGPVRSGQIIESEQDILLLGDVNPGGWVVSDGNIFVLGVFKGFAHAGRKGGRDKVICASWMEEPGQLRIADQIITDLVQAKHMEFAYLENDHIRFERLQALKKIRPAMYEWISFRK